MRRGWCLQAVWLDELEGRSPPVTSAPVGPFSWTEKVHSWSGAACTRLMALSGMLSAAPTVPKGDDALSV